MNVTETTLDRELAELAAQDDAFKPVTLSLRPSQIAWLDAIASKHQLKRSDVVQRLIGIAQQEERGLKPKK